MVKRRMAVFGVAFLLLATIIGGIAYCVFGSVPASAKRAGSEFVISVVQGDKDGVQAMLSTNARVTADHVIEMYGHLVTAKVSDVIKALPNQTGVEYVVLVSGHSGNGFTETSILLMKREERRWVIVYAGKGTSY